MDPLSVSASIVSLVGAADTVARRLYKYVKAAKGADKSVANLSREMTNLYGVLSSLHLMASSFENESTDHSMHDRSMQIDHIHACYNTLDGLRAILNKHDPSIVDSKLDSAFKRLHWPLSESKTKALLDEVGRHRQTLALALSADTMAALLQGLSLQKEISNGIEDIRSRMIASSISEARRKVLRWFTPNVDPQKYYSAALRLRQMGTGRWICENEVFKTWLNGSCSKLYLSGIPGAGKTVLTATIIEEIFTRTRQKGSSLAYFFCDYRDQATHDPRNILASVAGQLAGQDEECYAVAQAFFEEHNPSDGIATSPSIERLCECLRDMMKTLDNAYIVIDALDECVNRPPVLEVLHSLNDFENDCVRTLFTGREELDIQTALHDYEKISIAANSLDLRLYVDSEITMRSKNGTLRIRDPALQEEIRERLVQEAAGMFRWVTCQIDHICALSSDKSRRKALGTLPPDLPTTYERILETVKASNRENQIIVQRTLRWILWAVDPLSLAALSEAVSINVGDQRIDRDSFVDPESILKWCGSLVRKTPGVDTLELAHYSVQEFLEAIDGQAYSTYLMFRADVEHDSLELAKTCLTYLCFDDFDIDDVEDPPKMRGFLRENKLLRYCVEHWDKHARVKEDDETLLQLLQGFLKTDRTNQYLAWMYWVATILAEVYQEDEGREGEERVSDDEVRSLFSAMADSSPLHWAATLCLPSMCWWLIKNNCNVNQQNSFLGRPLLTAVMGRDPTTGRSLRCLERPLARENFRKNRYQTVKHLLDAGADRNTRDRFLRNTHGEFFECPSILSEALRGEVDWDIVQLLLDSKALCDRYSIDCLYHGGSKGFTIFQELKDHNIEGSQIDYFRQLAIDANLGWDRILEDLTASKLELSASRVYAIFFNAARFGRLQVMKKMISIIAGFEGKDINEVDRDGETALRIACRHNHPEIVDILIRAGVNINSVNTLGDTALMVAAEKNSTECVGILLQHGADVRITSGDGITALHLAAYHETPQMLEMILQSSIAKDSKLYSRTSDGHTLLHIAASHGSLPTIEYILENFKEASLFDRLQDGSTCLHLVARSGGLTKTEFFLDRGLLANDYNGDRKTPVYSAIESVNSVEIVHILHSRGADLNFQCAETGDIPLFHLIRSLRSASNTNTMSCFTFLLENTADVNHCDKAGKNCLHWLAESFPESYPSTYVQLICLTLLQRGCSMTRCSAEGISPFQAFIMRWSQVHIDHKFSDGFFSFYREERDDTEDVNAAAEFGNVVPQIGMTLFILKHTKADPKVLGLPENVNWQGASLLGLALRTGDEGAIRQVLEYDSEVDRRPSTTYSGIRISMTAVEWLCTGESNKIKRHLVRHLFSLSQALERENPNGHAPIHIASLTNHMVALEELLDMGVDVDSLSTDAKSPLMYACISEKLQAMRLLYERGARVYFSESHDALMDACENGHTKVLSTLFDMSELNVQWGRTFKSYLRYPFLLLVEDMTYYHYAAYHNQANVLKWLLEVGLVQDVNSVVGDEEFTALYLAACNESSYTETLPLLLSKGADVSKCTTRQRTALHVAAIEGNVRVIELLLSHSADPSAADSMLLTPYVLALENNQHLAAHRILEYMTAQQNENRWLQIKDKIGRIDDLSMGKALRRFAKLGQVDLVQILLDKGADVNARSRNCTTPVMKASKGGHLEVLDLLKDRGADFKAKDSVGDNALSHACMGLQSLVVPGLLELGLTFSDSSYYDWTPLHDYANSLEDGFHESLQHIILAHADLKQLSPSQLALLLAISVQNKEKVFMAWILNVMDPAQRKDAINNLTYKPPSYALHRASFEGSVEKLDMLLDAGADIDLRSQKISSPLVCAADMGRMEAVQFLAKRGAKMEYSKPDGTKETAVDAAKNYPKVQEWLRDFGKEKGQGLESEGGSSDGVTSLGSVEEDVAEAVGV